MKKNVFYLFLITLLSGCGYPQERIQQLEKLPEHIHHVQTAVDTYFKEKKVLPYRYSEDECKLTTKYLVDFREISGQLSQIPPSAFEKGGNFMYVLTDVDRSPKVRLFDLRVQDKVEHIRSSVLRYQQKYKQLPIKEKLGPHMNVLNLNELDMSDEAITSPYHPGEKRGFLIDNSGGVYVDYRNDVMRFIQERKFKVDAKEDLRWILSLSEESMYVPAYSPIMRYIEKELVLFPVMK